MIQKGWNNFTYDKVVLFCTWNMKSNVVYNWYLIIVNVVIPFNAIFFCYSKIYIFTQKSKNRSLSLGLNRSIHLAKTFFASFMVYSICWMPFGIVLLLDFDSKLPKSVVVYSIALAILNSSLNPIIYAICNSNFRNSFGHLFHKICCCSFNFNLRINKISDSGNRLSTQSNGNNPVKNQTRALYDT